MKRMEKQDPAGFFIDWEENRELAREAGRFFASATIRAGEDFAGAFGLAFDLYDPNISDFITRKTFKFADEVNKTTKEHLKRELEESIRAGEALAERTKRVQKVFDRGIRGTRPRARLIARTESASIVNHADLIAAKQTGVVSQKAWLTARDERVRMTHRDAEAQGFIPIDSAFQVGDYRMTAPGDPNAGVEELANCRCTLIYKTDRPVQVSGLPERPAKVPWTSISSTEALRMSNASAAAGRLLESELDKVPEINKKEFFEGLRRIELKAPRSSSFAPFQRVIKISRDHPYHIFHEVGHHVSQKFGFYKFLEEEHSQKLWELYQKAVRRTLDAAERYYASNTIVRGKMRRLRERFERMGPRDELLSVREWERLHPRFADLGDSLPISSTYALRKASEYFAETWAKYFLEPTRLVRVDPEAFALIDRFVKAGEVAKWLRDFVSSIMKEDSRA